MSITTIHDSCDFDNSSDDAYMPCWSNISMAIGSTFLDGTHLGTNVAPSANTRRLLIIN